MIDINKSRSNYSKFLKQKCEPVLLVQQQKQEQQPKQLSNNQSTRTATGAAAATTTTAAASSALRTNSNLCNELKSSLAAKSVPTRTRTTGRGIPVINRTEQRATLGCTSIANSNTNTTTTTTITTTTSNSNAVRKANQQFFLIPDFQDQNFLREECEIAHAQVATPPSASPTLLKKSALKTNATASSTKSRKDAVETKDAAEASKQHIEGIRHQTQKNYSNPNNNHNNNNNNNNNVSFSVQPKHQQEDVEAARFNIVKQSAAPTAFANGIGMRRYVGGGSGALSYGSTLESTGKTKTTATTQTTTETTTNKTKIGSTTTTATTKTVAAAAATTHKIDIQFNGVEPTGNHKSAPIKATTATYPSSSTVATKSPLSNGVSNKVVKPLVHRTTATAVGCRGENTSSTYTNKLNNNNSSSSNNSNNNNNYNNNSHNSNNNATNNNNNSMTATASAAAATLDHDDIKYIDSDENTGLTPPSSAGSSASAVNGTVGKFVQCLEPSSHITNKTTRTRPKSTIVCSSNHHVFEKINNYKYANGSAQSSSAAVEATYAAASNSRRQAAAAHTTIDSNSIKASIEKFNSLSEQKRAPMSHSVALRAHAVGATGSTSNLQYHRHSGSDFDNCNLRQLAGATSGGGSLTRNPYRASSAAAPHSGSVMQNAPLKAKVRLSDNTATTGTTTYKATVPNVTSKQLEDRRTQQQQQQTVATAGGSSGNAELATVTDESIRTTSTKSVLPPASPTTSRYWDRDSGRTTSLSTLSSTTHNNIDGDKTSTSSDEKSEGLCGLRNIGNTCFMNSIIQCLSHTNELTKFLRNYSGQRSSSATKDQLILQEFAKLIREMWTSNVHSVTPMDLKRAFSTKHRMYSDYNQQDAQEFLRFFLDSLHSALNSGVKGEPLKIDDNLSDNKKADLTWEWYSRHENSLIRDLFVGQLKSTLRCTTCGNTSVTFDPFWDLSVPLPSSSRCKLDACLDLFIREEVLDGDEMPTCSKCKTRRKCTKSFTIQRFPKYLVIHLKRFSETRWSKMSNIVEFPTGERELNMGPYGANANTNMYYSLYAISNHMGSTAGGHYVALCKHPVSKKWHEFNDNIVSDPLSESHLVSSSAYILFYERA